MRYFFPFFTILLIPVYFTSCHCPSDEQIGTLELRPAARSFTPFTGSETLVFQNENGETLQFTAPAGEQVGSDRLCVRTICTEARFNSPSSCEFFAAESRRYVFRSSDNRSVIDILLYSGVHGRNTQDFFDALQVGLTIGAPSTEAGWVIEQRFNGTLDPNKTGIANFFELRDSLTLNGRLFENTLVWEDAGLGIYFQTGKGVVGLKGEGKTWVRE